MSEGTSSIEPRPGGPIGTGIWSR